MPGVLVRVLLIVPELVEGGKLKYVLMKFDGGLSAMGLCIPRQEESPRKISRSQDRVSLIPFDLICARSGVRTKYIFCQIVNHTTLSTKTWKTNAVELWLQVSAVLMDPWG